MILLQTKIMATDNSGIRVATCIKIYYTNVGSVNNIVLVSVKNLKFHAKLKKGDLFKAIIIRTKKKINVKMEIVSLLWIMQWLS